MEQSDEPVLTRWQRFYSEDPRVLTTPPSQSSADAIAQFYKRQLRTIFDSACGVGRNTLALARAGFDATGVDASTSDLHIANSLFRLAS